MQSNEYWQQRFTLLEDAQNKISKEYLEVLKEEYEKSLSKIEKDITNWYTRIADNNEISYFNAKKILNKRELQDFKWTVEEYIEKGKENAINQQWITELENASSRVHIEKLEAIKMQIQNELEQLCQKQEEGTTDLLKQQYQDNYYKSAYEIQRGLEQYWNIQPLDTNKVDKIISKPWTTDNKTFSNRIWENKEQLVNTIQKDLTQATIRGDNLQEAINKISKDFNVAKSRAGTLVMTESAFFSSAGQRECFNNLGVEKYEIVATLDTHTSEICQKLDGKVFDMKDYQVGITAPPFHCNCRTVTAPYFDDEFTIGEKRAYRDENGRTKYVDSKTKYKEWKDKYANNETNVSTNNAKNDKISKNKNKEGKELHYIGKIDKNKIGEYGKRILTDDIVLTDERKIHIYEDHEKDYETIINNLDRVALNPKEVLEDCKNKDTLFLIDKLEKNNLNVVVKLNTTNNKEHPQNSVMTAWIIRDRNLKKLREKNKTIYKDE